MPEHDSRWYPGGTERFIFVKHQRRGDTSTAMLSTVRSSSGVLAFLTVSAASLAMNGCGGGAASPDTHPRDMRRAATHIARLPDTAGALGLSTAKGEIELFEDVSAPNAYLDIELIPVLLDRFVRPGRLRLMLRTVTSTDGATSPEDAKRTARYMQAAGLQSKLWPYYYKLRGTRVELTDEQPLREALKGTSGISVGTAIEQAGSHRVGEAIRRANRYAANVAADGGPDEPLLVVDVPHRPRVVIDLSTFPSVSAVVRRIAAVTR